MRANRDTWPRPPSLGLRPIHLVLPVFMKITGNRNFLFYARCGAKDFFDKLKRLHLQPFPVFGTVMYRDRAGKMQQSLRKRDFPLSICGGVYYNIPCLERITETPQCVRRICSAGGTAPAEEHDGRL